MLLNKVSGWKTGVVVVCLATTLTGCTSTGGFLAKMKPSSIRKAWNKSRTGLEEPGEVHQSYAQWQEQQGNLTEARESYNVVLERNPKAIDAMLGLARLDQLGGQPQKAEQMIKRAEAQSPSDPEVLGALGQLYISQGRYTEATDALRQAAHVSPNDTTIQYNLGVALARSGDLDSARPYFERTVGKAEAHYNIAYILNEMGHSVMAEQELMASLQEKPGLVSAQQLLSEVRTQHTHEMIAQGIVVPQQQLQPQMQMPMQPGQPQYAAQSYGAQQYAAMPQQGMPQQGMPVMQTQPNSMPIQQVQAQMGGQPQQQVVEAYWQNQQGAAPQNQVMHATGQPQPGAPVLQQQYIGGGQPAMNGQQLEQWNPQGGYPQ